MKGQHIAGDSYILDNCFASNISRHIEIRPLSRSVSAVKSLTILEEREESSG